MPSNANISVAKYYSNMAIIISDFLQIKKDF